MEFIILYAAKDHRAKNCNYCTYILQIRKNNLDILNANHWKLMENIIRLLQPFEELTKRASDDDVDLSFVIPSVNALQKYLAKTWKDSGVKTMKDEL